MEIKKMGNKNSKPNKANKEIKDERVLKIGLGVGKGDMNLEGNFQLGWVRKTNKKYTAPNPEPDPDPEPPSEDG